MISEIKLLMSQSTDDFKWSTLGHIMRLAMMTELSFFTSKRQKSKKGLRLSPKLGARFPEWGTRFLELGALFPESGIRFAEWRTRFFKKRSLFEK